MAAGFPSYNQFGSSGFFNENQILSQQTYFDDTQLTYAAQYQNYFSRIGEPFNTSPQDMFLIATSGYLQMQRQWMSYMANMFAPTPEGY